MTNLRGNGLDAMLAGLQAKEVEPVGRQDEELGKVTSTPTA